jgi:hypothetical protein
MAMHHKTDFALTSFPFKENQYYPKHNKNIVFFITFIFEVESEVYSSGFYKYTLVGSVSTFLNA